MIAYYEIPKKLQRGPRIGQLDKVTRYMVKGKKSIVFIYINNKN